MRALSHIYFYRSETELAEGSTGNRKHRYCITYRYIDIVMYCCMPFRAVSLGNETVFKVPFSSSEFENALNRAGSLTHKLLSWEN